MLEETGVLNLTDAEARAECTTVWVPLDDVLAIFGAYEALGETDHAYAGLYLREYSALKVLVDTLQESTVSK